MTDPFLDAIRLAPADRGLRLIYADWLEERDDPRHALIRACERMREVPVYADEYWQLKRRRNELRERFPREWVEAVRCDGSDYDPIFRDGVPDDVKGRWRLVREFTERWHGLDAADVGGYAAEADKVERKLGVRLPPSVREFVAYGREFYDESDPFSADPAYALFHGAFTHPSFERLPDNLGIAFLDNVEGDIECGISWEELANPDPPTFMFCPETNAPPCIMPDAAYLSLSILMHASRHVKSAGWIRGPVADPAVTSDLLTRDYPIRVRWGGVEIFEGDEVIIFLSHRCEHDFPGYLSMVVRRPIPRASLPPYLLMENAFDSGLFVGGQVGRVNTSAGGINARPEENEEWLRQQRRSDPAYQPPQWSSAFARRKNAESERARAAGTRPVQPGLFDDITF